jgi:hypothetical protein
MLPQAICSRATPQFVLPKSASQVPSSTQKPESPEKGADTMAEYSDDNERVYCGHYEYLDRTVPIQGGFLICAECSAKLRARVHGPLSVAILRQCERTLDTFLQGLRCLCVLEGSTLGAQIISRRLEEQLRLRAGSGASFFKCVQWISRRVVVGIQAFRLWFGKTRAG